MPVEPVPRPDPLGASPGEVDLLDSGLPEPTRRRRWLRTALLAVLALVAATGWQLDLHRRDSEYAELLACVESGSAAVADADTRVRAMVAYVRPSFRSGPTTDVERAMYAMVADQASAAEPALRRATARCRSVEVLPFHGRIAAARSAYVQWLLAESRRLRATAGDGAVAFRAGDPRVPAARLAAGRALADIAPDAAARARVARFMSP